MKVGASNDLLVDQLRLLLCIFASIRVADAVAAGRVGDAAATAMAVHCKAPPAAEVVLWAVLIPDAPVGAPPPATKTDTQHNSRFVTWNCWDC